MKTETKCYKCSGQGYIGGFLHIESGKCFQCAGSGTVEIDLTKPAKSSGRVVSRKDRIAQIKRILDALNEGERTGEGSEFTVYDLAAVIARADLDVRARAIAAFPEVARHMAYADQQVRA